MRRRGYSPESIRKFIDSIGYTKFDALNDMALLEAAVREDLNAKALRVSAVVNPVKLVITNYPEGETEEMVAVNNPENEADGTHTITFSRNLWIERDDFMEDAPKKFFRMTPGKEVRLKNAYIVMCTGCTKDADGNIIYVPIEQPRNMTPTGIKVMDDFIQHLARGEFDVMKFCKQYNARTSDLDGMVFLLTGMSYLAFRTKWQIHTADLLLRYTDMGVAEVARRCGMGSRTNMYFIYERELDTSPTERRHALRQQGDLGRFAVR
jgi:AraC-like DNA-binding protein